MKAHHLARTLNFIFLFLLLNQVMKAQNIIPYPNKMELQAGNFTLSVSTKIYCDKNCANEAAFLQRLLKDEHSLQTEIIEKNLGWQVKEIKRKLPEGCIYLTTSVINADTMATSD